MKVILLENVRKVGSIGEIIDVEINSFNKKNLFGFHKLNKEKAA